MSAAPLEERTLAGLHEALSLELRGLPPAAPVLDFGCGSGAWLARLSRLGFTDLTGVDAGPRPAFAGMAFIQADLDAAWRPTGRRYRVVTMIEVIEHLANPGLALQAISGALADDGMALVTSPNMHALRSRLRMAGSGRLAAFDDKGDPTHVTPLFLPGFLKLAARHGLALQRAWTFPARGTQIYGRPLRFAAALLRPLVADPLPGDTLCLRLVRSPAPR